MVILHFDLQPQFKYMNYFIYYFTSELWVDNHDDLVCILQVNSTIQIGLQVTSGKLWKITLQTSW